MFDVDGVFTDGGITPIGESEFYRTYCARDGFAFTYAARLGYKIFIITGGRGRLLRERFEYLGAKEVHIACTDKIAKLNDIFIRYDLSPENVIFMGDDIPDLECMQAVGIPVCPADASSEIIDASRYVSEFAGGKGCVRDIIEQVLRAQNRWATDSKGVASN